MITIRLNEKSDRILKVLIIVLYLISLTTESFSGGGGILGIQTLLFGSLSIIFGHYLAFAAWSSNILFFITFMKKIKLSIKLILSGLSVLLAFTAVFITDLPMNEGSSTSSVKIGIGFYFWISGIVMVFLKLIVQFKNRTERE